MMIFNDFLKEYNLRNKATSNIKIQHVLSSLPLDGVGIYLTYFYSYGVVCPKKLSRFIMKRNGYCL